jgi:GGDEF domain-containing protein
MPGEPAERRKRPPRTRTDLRAWIHDHLRLSPQLESELVLAVDAVFDRQEHLWQESKREAVRALSAAFADKMEEAERELNARDATVSSISRYFERLVAELTEKSNRDPKTKLMNFDRFSERLESFLELEQRGRWCAVGLVDITGFKWYNDALGHAVGDRIIARVAQLLREQIRSDDLIAQERPGEESAGHAADDRNGKDLHARFGGDEFCFLVPDLAEYHQAYAVAERFREAVQRYDWVQEDQRLTVQPVHVDVGVVCLWLGPVSERRPAARRLASGLIQRADELMYQAKGQRASHIFIVRTRVSGGDLVDMRDDEAPAGEEEPEEFGIRNVE